MVSRVPLLLPFVLLVVLFITASTTICTAQDGAPRFQCGGTRASCQALVGYVTDNETSYSAIKSLFQVKSIRALLGANNLSVSTPASARVTAGTLVKVPFPCACANGTGVSDRRPVYTVVAGDTLYDIATQIYKRFVVYPQIVAVNNLKNESLIEIGQKLWIPLPCSCDPVKGTEAVHLAHLVAKGSSLATIAGQYGTTQKTLGQINNISDPMTLEEGQVLDVPLRACNSSIRSDSLDLKLRVPNGSYALTARNCVKCSCSSSSWQLQCEMVRDLNLSKAAVCRAETCRAASSTGELLSLGNATSDGCGSARCEYAGYNRSIIFTTLVADQSACGTTGSPGSGAQTLRPPPWGPSWTRQLPLSALYTALLLLGFL